MMTINERKMKTLITFAKEIYHATSVLDSLNQIGLMVEPDINNEKSIGYHLYECITIAHDEICELLNINKNKLTVEQIDKLNNILMDMDTEIVTKTKNDETKIKETITNTIYMISQIIKENIIIQSKQ